MRLLTSSARRLRHLVPELARFGVVGLCGLATDVGGFNLLRYAGGEGPLYDHPLTAKVLSAAAATAVSWWGSRHWTFRHSRRAAAGPELAVFVLACTLGTGIALACLATSHYLLGLTSPLADNIAANVVGLGLGTAFRFWAYRTHVFNEGSRSRVVAADPPAPDPAAADPHEQDQPDHLQPQLDRLA